MPQESSAPGNTEVSGEHYAAEAACHLAAVRAVLAQPLKHGVDSIPVLLARACDSVRAAAAKEPLRPEAPALAQLRRELSAVQVLLAAAVQRNSARMLAAGMLSGMYGPDAETIPAACVSRISVQG